jgi:hypothetical protein
VTAALAMGNQPPCVRLVLHQSGEAVNAKLVNIFS